MPRQRARCVISGLIHTPWGLTEWCGSTIAGYAEPDKQVILVSLFAQVEKAEQEKQTAIVRAQGEVSTLNGHSAVWLATWHSCRAISLALECSSFVSCSCCTDSTLLHCGLLCQDRGPQRSCNKEA